MSDATWLPVGGLIGYGVAFSVGLSPIPAALLGEMFPAHLKGLAACSAAISLSIASLVVTKLYQVRERGDAHDVHTVLYCLRSARTLPLPLVAGRV